MYINSEIRSIPTQSCHFCLSICPRVTAVWTKSLVCPTGDRKNSHKITKNIARQTYPRSAAHFLGKYAYTCDPGACYRPPGIKFAFWKHKKRGTKKRWSTIVGSGVTRGGGGCSYVIYTASPVYMYTILNVRGN